MAILEVAIGVVFYFVTLSLLCSTIAEWWSRRGNRRSALLEDGIRLMLGGQRMRTDSTGLLRSTGSASENAFLKSVLEHPLIRTRGKDEFPDSIESRNFANAVLAVAGKDQALESLHAAKDAVEKIQQPDVKRTLTALLTGTATTVEDLQGRIAGWFDAAMLETTSLYRQGMDLVVRWAAVVLVVALNADALALMEVLWKEPTLRATIVAAAEEFAQDKGDSNAPKSKDDARVQDPQKNPAPSNVDSNSPKQEIDTLLQTAQKDLAPFPLGWPSRSGWSTDPRGFAGRDSWVAIPMKLAGWAVTILAVSLGAPFWFDLLRQLLSLRRGGSEPPKPTPSAVP